MLLAYCRAPCAESIPKTDLGQSLASEVFSIAVVLPVQPAEEEESALSSQPLPNPSPLQLHLPHRPLPAVAANVQLPQGLRRFRFLQDRNWT